MARRPIHAAGSPSDRPGDPLLASTGNKKNVDIINLQQSINMRDSVISGGTKINYQLSSDDNESQNDLPPVIAGRSTGPKPFAAQESQILISDGEKLDKMIDKTQIGPSAAALSSALRLNLDFKEADFDRKKNDKEPK